jgi:hypothetical protein
MNTKKLICFLAGAALLLSCVGCAEHRHIGGPSGRRTERVGTVTDLTTTTITLTCSSGTCHISRSDSCLKVTGSLAVGNTVDIIFCVPASSAPGATIDTSCPCL